MNQYKALLLVLTWLGCRDVIALPTSPHIVFIVADDLGYNDVGWNNPDMMTPNMDRLAQSGVILDQNYVYALCSPSRAAFMTGRYVHKIGLQHQIINGNQPNFVPLKYEMIPKKLREQGYHTHMLGKWHLGFCNISVTPTERGFDSFFGYYNGAENYYTHKNGMHYDFRWNKTAFDPYNSKYHSYSTIAYGERAIEIIDDHHRNTPNDPMFMYLAFQAPHAPLTVPDTYKNRISSKVTNADRRTYSGMVLAMDQAIGSVVDKLNATGMLDNALIVFTSDNGGSPSSGGSNYPLRGTKGSYWEGGIRVPAFVYSKTLLTKSNYRSKSMVHATDWYATFLNLAGGNAGVLDIDGIDQWKTLSNNGPAARTQFVLNFDNDAVGHGFYGIRSGSFKLMLGSPGHNGDIYSVPTRRRRNLHRSKRQRHNLYFFDLDTNPTENVSMNLFHDGNHASIQHTMRRELNALMTEMVPVRYPDEQPQLAAAAAAKDNNYWSSGWCDAS